MLIYLFMLAFLPSAVLLMLFYYFDKYEKEPVPKLFQSFLGGMIISVPILLLHGWFPWLRQPGGLSPVATAFYESFISAALVEEVFKFLVVWFIVFCSSQLNEPFDGMLYYATIGAGFAVIEDFMYIIRGSLGAYEMSQTLGSFAPFVRVGLEWGVLRSLPGHLLFGAIGGYFLSKARFANSFQKGWLLLALLVSILLHGFHNVLLLLDIPILHILYWFYLLLLVAVVFWLGRRLIRQSPFAKPHNHLSREEKLALSESKSNREGALWIFLMLSVFIIGLAFLLVSINLFLQVKLFS
ncbi:PrsW family intramembrane metalloprotease [bacterium]|nr:PrsW family intramembrane metalloprotease [bacterium]